jgi:glutaminyl-tRNA synthetase
MTNESPTIPEPNDFIRDIVAADVKAGKNGGKVVTRFPPEPNGYLHIGHAKAICIDFGVAAEFGGVCNLRMDDTNPAKEDTEYVDSIKEDIRWLGFDWGDRFFYAADYFERIYKVAQDLIRAGKAYVCEVSQEDWKQYRGIPTEPGRESPFRNRSIDENLALFDRMRAGEFPDGSKCLRAKIDMSSPNLHMRDPVLYRIMRVPHYRTGDRWCIYPMYDFAHPLEDAFEGITHSLCTLEFEVHRPLYDWVVEQLNMPNPPRQFEFARLSLTYTVLSKRYLLELVKSGVVKGWDDPRMPTISGLRRRGFTPQTIRSFCKAIGVTKFQSVSEIGLLEYIAREELNKSAPRAMTVLDPVRLVIENYPEGKVEYIEAQNNPEDPSAGKRKIPFTRNLYIERDDFMEVPVKKFFRLAPGTEVRIRFACIIKCTGIDKDPVTGHIREIRCTYDPSTFGPQGAEARKVKGTIHWVSAEHALDLEVRMYDRLFTFERPDEMQEGKDYKEYLNRNSLTVLKAKGEESLRAAQPGSRFQFERKGYFFADPKDSKPDKPVFNLIVSLRDSWAKIAKAGK